MTSLVPILFEDDDLVIIAKPGNIVTNRAKSVSEETLQDWFAQRQQGQNWPEGWQRQLPEDFSDEYGTPEEIYAERQGMVHRLDKATSGAMVFAKHPGSLLNLLTQFGRHQVHKEYLALTHGKFRVEEGTLNLPLGRSRFDRQKFTVDINGRQAVTQYKVEKTFNQLDWSKLTMEIGESAKNLQDNARLYEAGFALVRCLPKTGRTHQIRVHLSHEHHPIVGDVKYIGRRRAKLDPIWCPRQFLHAEVLEFIHPRTGQTVKFIAPLPEDLSRVLSYLR